MTRVPLKASVACCLLLAACSSQPPYRTLAAPAAAQCSGVFGPVDKLIAESVDDKHITAARDAIRRDLENPAKAPCWTATREAHADFDLFTVEFDDQGWLAGAANDPALAERQIGDLMARMKSWVDGPLEAQGKDKGQRRPLSIVLYTHGWHHSAAPDDENMIRFRGWLANTAKLEKALCVDRRKLRQLPSSGGSVCAEDEKIDDLSLARSRVVGIYVGWRGDSVNVPFLDNTSIWDRKLAAEKVALGSAQQLYAELHAFWFAHRCHAKPAEKDCADVRLLSLGHSFGGLITFRALAPRLMSGIVETSGSATNGPGIAYAYGFGDLSVLVNPAFEGSRYEPLALAAGDRGYEKGEGKRSAQLPLLIIAQSRGDVATHFFFPLFRSVTTAFESTQGAENEANIDTVGWNRRYVTHTLALDPKHDACLKYVRNAGLDSKPEAAAGGLDLDAKLVEDAGWYGERCSRNFREFNGDLNFCGGLVLHKVKDPSARALNRPDFMPLWVLQTDKAVIADHNDYLNPHLLDFVGQMYYTLLRATDLRFSSAQRSGRSPGQCN